MKLAGRLSRFAAIALFVAFGSSAIAQPSPALTQKSSEAVQLIERVQDEGYIRIIVQFESPVPAAEITPAPESISALRAQVAAIQDAIIADHFGSATAPAAGRGFSRDITRFDLTPGFGVTVNETELESLAADPRVKYITYNEMLSPTLDESVPLIGMNEAYSLGALGTGHVVVVLDTGVQSNHEFLAGKVAAEACFSNNNVAGGGTLCPNGQGTQTGAGAANPEIANCIIGSFNICDHGTHVAGIAAGLNSNRQTGEPANGVAKRGSIWAIQIFTRTGSRVGAFNSDIIRGLDHVFANMNGLPGGLKVDSTNMSLGGGLSSTTCDTNPTKPAIDRLRSAGVLSAIASGNDGSTNQVSAPGCVSTAVTVGSTTKSDVISSFSNMSAVVDLHAPGSSIQSSIPIVPSSTTAYSFFSGTSMATPHVAGAIAAIRGACPEVSADAIESALKSTGLPIADTRSGGTQTKPRIRVNLALEQLSCVVGPPNNSFANAIAISLEQSLAGTNVNATKETGEPNHAGNAGGKSVWWSFAAAANGPVTLNTFTSTFDTLLAVYVGDSVGSLTPIASNDDANGTLQSSLVFAATAGTTYRIAVDGYNGASGAISLTASPTPTLIVDPPTDTSAAGDVGGPIFPPSFDYSISATNGMLDYNITTPTWLTASSDSGTVGTSPFVVTFTFNETALTLPEGVYTDSISFNNQSTGQGDTTRGVTLTLVNHPIMAVEPATDFDSAGDVGGPFLPDSKFYTVTNTGTGTLHWTAGPDAAWVTVFPPFGALEADESTFVEVSIDDDADALAVGAYLSTVFFTNTDNGDGDTTRNVSLDVKPKDPEIEVKPATDLTSSGEVGGPFSPGSTIYTVRNLGSDALDWTAGADSNWVTVDPPFGVLAADESIPVEVSIDDDANALAEGNYSSIVSFTNTENGKGNTTRSVDLTVEPIFIRNDLLVSRGSAGLWEFLNNRTWVKVHPLSSTTTATGDVDGNGKDDIVAVFASGTWVGYDNGNWLKLQPRQLLHVATGDLDGNGKADIVGDFANLGLFAFMNNTRPFVRLNINLTTRRLATGDLNGNGKDEVVAVFGNGTWVRYDNGNWVKLQPRQLLHAVTGDLDGNGMDDVVGDFAGLGVYAFMNNLRPLVRLRTIASQGLATGDVNGNGRDEIVATFADGTWVLYDDGRWVKLQQRRLLHAVSGDLDTSGKDEIIGDLVGAGLRARYNDIAPWVRLRPEASQGLAVGGFD